MRGPVEPLAALFRRCLRDAARTPIDDSRYLAMFGIGSTTGIRTVVITSYSIHYTKLYE